MEISNIIKLFELIAKSMLKILPGLVKKDLLYKINKLIDNQIHIYNQ